MTNQEKALSAFVGTIGEINERMEELKEFFDNHMNRNPDDVSWATVSTAQAFLAELTEMADRAYSRGEYKQ